MCDAADAARTLFLLRLPGEKPGALVAMAKSALASTRPRSSSLFPPLYTRAVSSSVTILCDLTTDRKDLT